MDALLNRSFPFAFLVLPGKTVVLIITILSSKVAVSGVWPNR